MYLARLCKILHRGKLCIVEDDVSRREMPMEHSVAPLLQFSKI